MIYIFTGGLFGFGVLYDFWTINKQISKFEPKEKNRDIQKEIQNDLKKIKGKVSRFAIFGRKSRQKKIEDWIYLISFFYSFNCCFCFPLPWVAFLYMFRKTRRIKYLFYTSCLLFFVTIPITIVSLGPAGKKKELI